MSAPRTLPSAGEEGFNLIEILMAMLLLCIVLTGTMALQATILRAAGDSRITSSAMVLAQSRIEEFRARDFLTLPGPAILPDYFQFDLTPYNPSTPGTTHRFFTRSTTITAVPPAYEIRVRVEWSLAGSTGNQSEANVQSIELASLRTRTQ